MPIAHVNGTDIFYRASGQGEPLVLIMGLGANHSSWGPQIPAFKKHYRIVTFDSRGIGKSARATEPYTLRTLADDVIALMDHLGMDNAHVLGVSLGGMVAQEIAISYPQRVRKLVLVSTTPGGGGPEDVHPELLKAMGLKEGSSPVGAGSVDPKKFIGPLVSLAFNRRLYRLFLVPVAKIYMRLGGFEGIAAQMKAVEGHNTRDRLGLIKASTLVITGDADRLVPPSLSDVLASQIPNARLVKVEGGSHAFHFEMKKRFNREVLDFLGGS
jgi:pimeloyl-ACP methyl ester carboxylesterase